MKGINILLVLVFLLISSTQAQEGPTVPCVGCDSLTQAPLPESGLWHNPEQSPGSGLNFEIQNGVLAGFFYAYDTDGNPEWELLSGQLVVSEKPGVVWELETTLIRAQGGSCRDCAYTPPQISNGDTIRLEFMQRNYLRITIGSFDQYFVPFIYGSSAKAFFPNKTPYLFPEFSGTTPFILVFKGGPPLQYPNVAPMVFLNIKLVGIVQVNNARTLRYSMDRFPPPGDPPPPNLHIGLIDCQLDTQLNEPVCMVEISHPDFASLAGPYLMPVGNFGNNRFFAEDADGTTIEGYRFDYD